MAETFTVAWRRWDDLPDPPLPWLLGTARNLLSEDRRSLARGQRLADRLALLAGTTRVTEDVADTAFARERALQALASLTEDQREALLLVAWDGLSISEAAEVLELRLGAFRARLHRGRAALEAADAPGPRSTPHAATRPAASPAPSSVRALARLTLEENR